MSCVSCCTKMLLQQQEGMSSCRPLVFTGVRACVDLAHSARRLAQVVDCDDLSDRGSCSDMHLTALATGATPKPLANTIFVAICSIAHRSQAQPHACTATTARALLHTWPGHSQCCVLISTLCAMQAICTDVCIVPSAKIGQSEHQQALSHHHRCM